MQKNVLITGATAGIGRETALWLAGRGHRVFATGRDLEALAKLKVEAGDLPLETLPLDVTSSASIEEAARTIDARTEGRGVDVLVNNAGYATVGALAELGDDALRAQFDTNVFGLLAVTRALLPAMFARKGGRIVNVSSVSGRIPAPLLGAYHASKYALEALSDALRMELQPFGIDVVIVEPGTIRTRFAERVLKELDRERPAGSRYAPLYARADDIRRHFDRVAGSAQPVVDAITHAAEAKRPCTRYVAPRRFWLAIAIVSLLPTRLVDFAMRMSFGLTRRALAP